MAAIDCYMAAQRRVAADGKFDLELGSLEPPGNFFHLGLTAREDSDHGFAWCEGQVKLRRAIRTRLMAKFRIPHPKYFVGENEFAGIAPAPSLWKRSCFYRSGDMSSMMTWKTRSAVGIRHPLLKPARRPQMRPEATKSNVLRSHRSVSIRAQPNNPAALSPHRRYW